MFQIKNTTYLCLLFITMQSVSLNSQVTITFKLDMHSLIKQQLFSPSDGERVFLRGNFNQWQGEDYELKRNQADDLFTATFHINLSIGDTLEYKFILIKAEGQIYWEKNPNPENQSYGIGCGHTRLWIPSEYWNIVPKRLFPLEILLSNDKVFVCGHYSASTPIPIGSEIVAINKMPMRDIIRTLESITSSDAYIHSFKAKTVEKNFAKRYALYYGYPDEFIVDYIIPGEKLANETSLHPVGIETINKYPVRGSELSLQLLEKKSTAILTINTFIYYDQLEMFKSFIDSSFNVIQTKNIENLVMDLCGNNGGDPFCASYLFSYLAPKELPYFPEPYGKYARLAEPLSLPQNNFQGNLFTLIDGSCFSTTGHFCALLKYHKIGKFIGTETGATFTCTGNVRYLNLHHTRLILGTAREQRYSVAVKNMDKKSGVLPDYPVERSQNDLVAGKDTVLNFALDLIQN